MAASANTVRDSPFGLLSENLGQILKGSVFIPAKVQQRIAVADNALPIVLEQTLELRDALQNDVAADVSAAANRKDFFEILR